MRLHSVMLCGRISFALLRANLARSPTPVSLSAALRLDSTATTNTNIQMEEYNMTTINLRELYPWYTEDAFIEVSDEVAAFLEEDKRLQINYAQYIRDNKAFYSLDASASMPEQPDEVLERMELERLLQEALAQLTPAQRRRVLAYIVGGLSQLQIAARENTTQPAVHHSVRNGLSHLKRILKNFD